ncbi:MAG: hypothetical protein WBB76_02415 [Gaiellaceae bacterium]
MRAVYLGFAVATLVALATIAASWQGSGVRAGAPEGSDLPSTVFLTAACCAFAVYLIGLFIVRRRRTNVAIVCAVAAAIQLVPLAGPLVISRDVYAYWAYGRLAAVHHVNPYIVPPGQFANDPAANAMAGDWRFTQSVYGPVFSAASAGLAATSGKSPKAAALSYRIAGAVGMLAVTALAASVAPLPGFAAAFVGWNPLLAVSFAGGGHNDIWMMVFVLGALGLAARRPRAAGVSFALAGGLKWVAFGLLPLKLLSANRRQALLMTTGFLVTTGLVAGIAFFFFGTAWLTTLGTFASRRSDWAIPSRLEQFGLPRWLALVPLALMAPLLVRSARAGRPRMGLASILLLVATPWLLPWYAAWAVPLAAVEEDRLAWVLALAFSAYILPDGVPL